MALDVTYLLGSRAFPNGVDRDLRAFSHQHPQLDGVLVPVWVVLFSEACARLSTAAFGGSRRWRSGAPGFLLSRLYRAEQTALRRANAAHRSGRPGDLSARREFFELVAALLSVLNAVDDINPPNALAAFDAVVRLCDAALADAFHNRPPR